MAEQYSEKEINKALFAQLIMMLSSSVMQQLGKLVNPVTHKAEVDLESAQITIDMLSMLQAKTRGNLDKDEESMMTSVLSSLQMNYVETMESASKPEAKTGQPAAPDNPPAEVKDSGTDSSQKAEKKDTKYHKSYGG